MTARRNLRRTPLLAAAVAALLTSSSTALAAEDASNNLRGGGDRGAHHHPQQQERSLLYSTKKKARDADARRKKNGGAFGGANAGPGGKKKAALAAAGEGPAGGDKSIRKRPGGTLNKKKDGTTGVRKKDSAAAGTATKKIPKDDAEGEDQDQDDAEDDFQYVAQGASSTISSEEAAQLVANRGNDIPVPTGPSKVNAGYTVGMPGGAAGGPGAGGGGAAAGGGEGGGTGRPPHLCGSLTKWQPMNANFCHHTRPCEASHVGRAGGPCMMDEVCEEYPECLAFPKPKAMKGMNGMSSAAPKDPRTLRCSSPDDPARSAMDLCTTSPKCDDSAPCPGGLECVWYPQCKDYEPKTSVEEILAERERVQAEYNADNWLASKKDRDSDPYMTQGGQNGAQLTKGAPPANAMMSGGGGGVGGPSLSSPGIPGPNGPTSSGQPSASTGPRVSGGPAGSIMAQQQQTMMSSRPTFKCVDVSNENFDPNGPDVQDCPQGPTNEGNEFCRTVMGGLYEYECQLVPGN